MRSTLVLLSLLLFLPIAQAQKHDYNWVMGYEDFGNTDPEWGGLIMDFNTAPPSFHKVTTHLNFDAFGVSCSDSSGQLLFYSNGISIHNKLHEIMENGDTINPGTLWEQWKFWGYAIPGGGLCIPAPGKSNCYYMFHIAFVYEPPIIGSIPLYYTFIDMNANNGLGKVLEKNVILLNELVEIPIAIKHGNGRDWWLIVGKWGGSSMVSVFLIDESGVHDTGVQDFGPIPALWEGGLIEASQDGNQIVRAQYSDGARFFDFNRCTGILGNMRFIPRRICLSATHFSPDSKSVYVQTHRVLNTLDLAAIDTTILADTLIHHNWYADGAPPFYTTLGFGEMGPDGKMYFNQGTSTTTLHVINRPNLPGLASDIELNGVNLTRLNYSTTYNLPNYRLGEWEGSPCDTVNLQMPGDGFVRTFYDPARWMPEIQAQHRAIPDESAPSAESWEQDPLNLINVPIKAMYSTPPTPEELRQKMEKAIKKGHEKD
ncbi:MAG: hypothetical protein ACKVT2_02080 [Saprospiraceae bacterium]